MAKMNKAQRAAAAAAKVEETVLVVNTVEIPAEVMDEQVILDQIIAAEQTSVEAKSKPGRPVKEGSARQLRLAEMEARRIAAGGYVGRGRPVNTESERQKREQARLDKISAGEVIKRGRPKMIVVTAAPAAEIVADLVAPVEVMVESNTEEVKA